MPPAGSPSYYLIHVPLPGQPASSGFILPLIKQLIYSELLARTGNPWGMAKNTTQEQKPTVFVDTCGDGQPSPSDCMMNGAFLFLHVVCRLMLGAAAPLTPFKICLGYRHYARHYSTVFRSTFARFEDVFSWLGDWRRHARSKVINHRHECTGKRKEACGRKQSFALTGFICFFNTGGEWKCMRVYWNQNVHVCTFITVF